MLCVLYRQRGACDGLINNVSYRKSITRRDACVRSSCSAACPGHHASLAPAPYIRRCFSHRRHCDQLLSLVSGWSEGRGRQGGMVVWSRCVAMFVFVAFSARISLLTQRVMRLEIIQIYPPIQYLLSNPNHYIFLPQNTSALFQSPNWSNFSLFSGLLTKRAKSDEIIFQQRFLRSDIFGHKFV